MDKSGIFRKLTENLRFNLIFPFFIPGKYFEKQRIPTGYFWLYIRYNDCIFIGWRYRRGRRTSGDDAVQAIRASNSAGFR